MNTYTLWLKNKMFFSYLIIILFIIVNCTKGQTFIKVTTGLLVNEPGDSWGCSWSDYNNDGKQDLFVANVVNDFLYQGTGDSSFIKVTTGTVITDSVDSRGSSWGDYDNDGDVDLFVSTGVGNNLLYRNDGNGILTKITSGIIVNDAGSSRGCAWGDYDNDGRLDLYVANVGNDFLYHNDGGGNFTKITSGEIVSSGGQTIGCNWVDYNNDGFLDLYANNFNGTSFLFKNNGNSTFTKITSGAIVNDAAASTGGNWGDYDNDGDLDVFVSNLSIVRNFFYKNNGAPDYTFTKDTTSTLVQVPGESYAGSWVDYDNDGDLDLFVANALGINEFLFNNSGFPSYTFTRITEGVLVNDAGNSYGSTWADYDNDGDMDVFICNKFGQRNSLFENAGTNNSWVNIKCVGISSNKSGIGTRIRVKANINGNPTWQQHEIAGQSGYYSQNSLNAEFGFGNATVIDSLVIKWPGGQTETYINLVTNRFYTATQGQGITAINKGNKNTISGYALYQNYPNPFNPKTIINYELGITNFVNLKVYDILGQEVATLVNKKQNAGSYEIEFDGTNLPSGIYFYTLTTPGYKETKRMILLK